MKIESEKWGINNYNFGNKIYKFTKYTSYGRRIHGESRGLDYDVYVKENSFTKDIEHKLYCVFKDGNWVKSVLRFFNKGTVCKELRSQANDRCQTTN